MKKLTAIFVLLVLVGCAGIKVIHPNDVNKEQGTRMLDWTGGKPSIVETYSCKLFSNGNRFQAIGKSESEARAEVLARCRDGSVVSFCNADKINCFKN